VWRNRRLLSWRCRIRLSRRCGRQIGRRGAGFGGRGEDKALADQCEAPLRELGLEELIFMAGEEVGFFAGDGGDYVVDDDGITVECALLVGIGGQLDGLDGAFLFRDDGPKVAIVAGHGKNQKGFQSAGIEVR
jgi:hypothetical protein